MNFSINFTADKKHYEETWEQLVSITKQRKYIPLIAIGKIIFGIVFYFIDKQGIIGTWILLFCASGAYDVVNLYTEQKRWMKDRINSKVFDNVIVFQFNEIGIAHNGPFSNRLLVWKGLKSIIKTEKGIVLKPENGISIYLPFKAFNSQEEIKYILSKVNDIAV
jgi:hypothetical protein